MKKYLILAFTLTLLPVKNSFAAPHHYLYGEIATDLTSGAAHTLRILGMHGTNVKKIKQRALLALTASIASFIMKTTTILKIYTKNENPWLPALNNLKDVLEGWNALRMYCNAEHIAAYNEKYHRNKKKITNPQIILLLLLATNRFLNFGSTYDQAQAWKDGSETFLTKHHYLFTTSKLLSALTTALYEHGYYDVIIKAIMHSKEFCDTQS